METLKNKHKTLSGEKQVFLLKPKKGKDKKQWKKTKNKKTEKQKNK